MKGLVVVGLIILGLGLIYFEYVDRFVKNDIMKMALIASYIGLGFTLLLVVSTFQAVSSSKKASQAQVVIGLRTEYRSPEMHKAMNLLTQWKADHGDNWAELFFQTRAKGDDQAHRLEKARSLCDHYFLQLDILLKHQLIAKDIARSIFSKAQFDFLFGILEPLEAAVVADEETTSDFQALKKLYK